MIELKDVLLLHEALVQATGGANGIRDQSGLESAIARPFQTFNGEDLYQGVLEKVAALFESLILNHPFVDGNKRIGFIAGLSLLERNGLTILENTDNNYDFIVAIASGELNYEGILSWLQKNTRPY